MTRVRPLRSGTFIFFFLFAVRVPSWPLCRQQQHTLHIVTFSDMHFQALRLEQRFQTARSLAHGKGLLSLKGRLLNEQ